MLGRLAEVVPYGNRPCVSLVSAEEKTGEEKLFSKEKGPELALRHEPARLPEDRSDCSGCQLMVQGHRQDLAGAARQLAP